MYSKYHNKISPPPLKSLKSNKFATVSMQSFRNEIDWQKLPPLALLTGNCNKHFHCMHVKIHFNFSEDLAVVLSGINVFFSKNKNNKKDKRSMTTHFKNGLLQVWFKLPYWFWGRKCNYFVIVFSLFCYCLPLEKGVALFWTKVNFIHPGIHCATFAWNWLSGSREEDFLKSLFVIICPLKRLGPSFEKRKYQCPAPKIASCQVWLTFADWDWKCQCIFAITLISPL